MTTKQSSFPCIPVSPSWIIKHDPDIGFIAYRLNCGFIIDGVGHDYLMNLIELMCCSEHVQFAHYPDEKEFEEYGPIPGSAHESNLEAGIL